MSDLGAEVDSSWEACTVAGRRLRAAAMERRGEKARRAMADMICWRCGWRWRRWHSQDRSWNWLRLRFPHHRIRQEPLPEAAAVLLCHSWLCPLRGHGTFLSYDGFPPALRLLNTGCVEYRHLAPEERLLFPPAAVVQHNVAADWTFL